MPRFTVLTPTYNRMWLLKNSIQSIWDQDFEDYEHLIVDDGSNDGSLELLRKCEKIDKRTRVIKLPRHMGLVAALAEGNRQAQGEYIVKHDSDDFSFPNRLSVINDYLRKNPDIEFLYHGFYQT